jgi:hypothetical protein
MLQLTNHLADVKCSDYACQEDSTQSWNRDGIGHENFRDDGANELLFGQADFLRKLCSIRGLNELRLTQARLARLAAGNQLDVN